MILAIPFTAFFAGIGLARVRTGIGFLVTGLSAVLFAVILLTPGSSTFYDPDEPGVLNNSTASGNTTANSTA